MLSSAISLTTGAIFLSTAFASDHDWLSAKFNWNEHEPFQASVWLVQPENMESAQVISAIISHSSEGQRNIYFRAEFIEELNMCDVQTQQDDVAYIDGQAVPMFIWCKQFSNNPSYYLELTPESDADFSYIIERFQRPKESVHFEYKDISVHIPTTGFSHSWAQADDSGNFI